MQLGVKLRTWERGPVSRRRFEIRSKFFPVPLRSSPQGRARLFGWGGYHLRDRAQTGSPLDTGKR